MGSPLLGTTWSSVTFAYVTRKRDRSQSVFQRENLRPSQLRTVAERRYADASCLCETGQNARANGAMYLAGFVVECLLKAELLVEYEWLQNARTPQGLSTDEARIWNLCYRQHALDEILARLPSVGHRVETRGGARAHRSLREICAVWTILVRYSPHQATIADASDFLARVKEIKQCLHLHS